MPNTMGLERLTDPYTTYTIAELQNPRRQQLPNDDSRMVRLGMRAQYRNGFLFIGFIKHRDGEWTSYDHSMLMYPSQHSIRTAYRIMGRNPSAEYMLQRVKAYTFEYTMSAESLFTEVRLKKFVKEVYDFLSSVWITCHCGSLVDAFAGRAHVHTDCSNCGAETDLATVQTVEYYQVHGYNRQVDEELTVHLCAPCFENRHDESDETSNCYECGYLYAEVDENGTFIQPDESMRWVCDICYSSYGYEECANCNVHSTNLTETIEEDRVCTDCMELLYPAGRINAWNFRPTLIFHPMTPVDPKKPLYIGMELEMSFDDNTYPQDRHIMHWLHNLNSDYRQGEHLFYAKSDSSVNNGWELVTHPFQPRWALDGGWHWRKYREIENLGVLETHSSAGTHIHMNKEAFTSAHLWKLLQVHFRQPEFCKIIGGRQDGRFASFSHHDVRAQRSDLMEIVKHKDKSLTDYHRYVAVNLQNEYTIELRYMRSGPFEKEVKKNIEWALALYEFTDYIDARDVKNGILDNAGYLLWFINQGDYPHLQEWLGQRLPSPLAIERNN